MKLKITGKRGWQMATLISVALVIVLLSQRVAVCPDAGAGETPALPANDVHTEVNTPQLVAPALVHPVNPLDYGARCDGVTDDTSAFQAALNASDVRVPAGTCVIDRTIVVGASNRHLECSPGATLKRTTGSAGQMFNLVAPDGSRLSGDSIANCSFVGANTAVPQFYNNDIRQNDIPVETQDRVDHFTLIGNTFSRFFGQSMFQTYGRVDGGNGDVIAYNRFESCGYYGPVFVAHMNGYIGHNTLVDCATGVENDNAQQNSGGNLIEYNRIEAVHGYGAPDMEAGVMLTGGAATGADYSGNIVRYNVVTGTSDTLRAGRRALPARLFEKAGGKRAQYIDNTCSNGCETDR